MTAFASLNLTTPPIDTPVRLNERCLNAYL